MNPKGAGAVAGVRGFSLGSRAMLYRLVFRTWHMMLGGSDYTSKLWSLYVVPAIQAARLDVACSHLQGDFDSSRLPASAAASWVDKVGCMTTCSPSEH